MIHRQNGFSLIGVVIAVALVGILATVFTALMSTMTKSQNRLFQRFEIAELTDYLQTYLADQTSCKCMLGGINLNGTLPVAIPKLAAGCGSGTIGSSVPPNNGLPGSQTGLLVESIRLQNIAQLSSTKISADLSISLSSPGGTVFRPVKVTKILNTLAGLSQVDSCDPTTTQSPSALCTQIGGFYDVSNKRCKLEVGVTCGGGQAIGGFDGSGNPICVTATGGGGVVAGSGGGGLTWKGAPGYCSGTDNTKNYTGQVPFSSCSNAGDYYQTCYPPISGCIGLPGVNFTCQVFICQ